MATARGAEFEKIKALDLGADDYLTKPFSMMELVARSIAILRRTQNNKETKGEVMCGPIVINDVKHTALVEDNKLDLS